MPKTKQPAKTAKTAATIKTAATVKTLTKASYELFHSSDSYFFTALQDGMGTTTVQDLHRAFIQGEFKLVHTFKYPLENIENQLESVFFHSQNFEKSWNSTSPCRSTSVGDVVRVGNEYWIVASQGFDRGWQD